MTDAAQLQASSAGVTRTVQRQWARSDAPAAPFVWSGLLPLLALALVNAYAVLPFARNDIERAVLSETRAKLDAQGMPWAELLVTGQHVIVRGSPPDSDAGEAALATARATTCPTWLGSFTCAVQVIGLFAPAIPKPTPNVEAAPAPRTQQQPLRRASARSRWPRSWRRRRSSSRPQAQSSSPAATRSSTRSPRPRRSARAD